MPEGRVITYRELAKALGTKAYQAIGQALKHNPYAPRVPCHRVIKNDGHIGGFMGKTAGVAINKKKELLAEEGVFFDSKSYIVDEKRIIEFE
ncbi:MGMT family protein [Candidatus Woesearchaeota archaeon]|nr:MGMT family protein [Candidatus Woesearchaeota archaeon]